MKYFLDTEFIEGFRKPLFGKKRHFIDLISIGIYREDGESYYAISNEYNHKNADGWVKKNVLLPLYIETVHGDARNQFDVGDFHLAYGKSNKQIAMEVLDFFGCWRDQYFWRSPEDIEVYGYYADYDWVLFCSLFGRMIDLPKGFPMYCKDLKQTIDERAAAITQMELTTHVVGEHTNWQLTGPLSKKLISIDDMPLSSKIFMLESRKGFPPQLNEHNALADAKWNKALYDFLNPVV